MPWSSALARALQEHKDVILGNWSAAVRRLPAARELDETRLRDSLPVLLDRVTAMAEELTEGHIPPTGPEDLSREHAAHRVDTGYAVDELLLDYTTLRDVIHDVLEATHTNASVAELRVLDRAIDRALVDTTRHFIASRERKFKAFERLVTGMSETTELTPMLDRLIDVFLESVPAVDTATVLIVDGDRLVVRATRGLEGEAEQRLSLPIGAGFAGTIAAERRAIFVPDAWQNPLVRSAALKKRGVRALYGVPLEHDGKVIGVAHMGSCVAESFSDDDTLLFRGLANRAAAAIAQAQLVEQLQRAAHFREQLVGVVSHDLRTPLNAITLGANLLMGLEGMPEQGTRTATRILRASDRMRRMIDQLLDFTRARLGGGVPLTPTDARLDDVCREVVGEIEMAHPARELSIEVRGDLRGRWDVDRLKQLVANIVENAVSHGDDASPVRITVDGTDAAQVCVAVHNDGAPIPPDEAATIFEPFRQATRSRTGLGLGLYIAQQVARAHGGDLTVASAAADGTTFTARLPRGH